MNNNSFGWTTDPEPFDPDIAEKIADEAKLILARMLPGCNARRFTFSGTSEKAFELKLCFSDGDPIAPLLSFRYGKYYSLVLGAFWYRPMFRSADDITCSLHIEELPGLESLTAGPRQIAESVCKLVGKLDLAEIIAGSAIERLLLRWPNTKISLPYSMVLAECAIYMRKYHKARELVEAGIKNANTHPFQHQERIPEAKDFLVQLDKDPDAMRQKLVAMTEYNWSHFEVVDPRRPL
jgi:hypothetical protein